VVPQRPETPAREDASGVTASRSLLLAADVVLE
jgi:hypothetical protein